jgi:hypothetical protein
VLKLFVFPASFGSPIRDQLGDQIAIARRLPKLPAQTFEDRERALEHESAALDAGVEDIALTQGKLLSQKGGNHDASLSTNLYLCHQGVIVADLKFYGINSVT